MHQEDCVMPYIFLNPDGTQEKSLYALVEFPTGVHYAHQCAGTLTEERISEGFLIPLGGPQAAQPLITWFWKSFHGGSYRPATEWGVLRIAELKQLVAEIPCWRTTPTGELDQRLFLELDEERLSECTEGWIRVKTAYGPGILIFDNCD